jgi:hypothetical protein
MPVLHLGIAPGTPLQAQLQARGPLVQVELVGPQFVVPRAQTATAAPPPLIVPGIALIDTGASNTSIATQVAAQLGLQATGVVASMSASGPYNAQQYTCGYRIDFVLIGVSAAPNLHPLGLAMLIGRDILSQCVLVYSGGSGAVTLSW